MRSVAVMQRARVSAEDEILPGTAAGPAEAGPGSDEEIRPSRPASRGTRMHESVAGRQPTRPLLLLPARRSGQFALTMMQAAAHARAGRVVDLWNRDGMVALTWEDGEYRLTEEALTPTPWIGRVRHHLDLLAEP